MKWFFRINLWGDKLTPAQLLETISIAGNNFREVLIKNMKNENNISSNHLIVPYYDEHKCSEF